MIKKILFLFIVFTLIMSCDSEESSSTDESTIVIDTTAPVASIFGLDAQLEITTMINISIQESSDIEEVSVRVNQEEILNTTEKTFSFELNPFDYPSGENTLTVFLSDSEGNENEQSQTFEVNKLLVSIAAPLVPAVSQLFFSVNTIDGDLVAFAPVTRPLEIVKLYAEDDFSPQPIVVTSYEMQPESVYKANLNSIANIIPGTDLVTFQEAGNVPTENTYNSSPIIENEIVLDITDITSEKLANSLTAVGFNHSALSRNTFEQSMSFETEVAYRYKMNETIENSIIYPSNLLTSTINDPINIDNYKYLFLENPSNSTVSFQEFKIPSRQVINIPNTATFCFLRTFGYLDTEAFRSHDFRFIYDINIENISSSLEIPMIEEFETLRNSLILTLNDRRRLEVSTLGLKDVSVPDWTASRSGNTINMTGEFDRFTLSFILGDNPDISMAWSFTDKYQENYVMPFESFVFPKEFINYAIAQNLNLLDFNTRGIFNVEQFDTSETLDYEDLLFSIYTYTFLGDVYILRSDL